MKHKTFCQDKNQKPPAPSPTAATKESEREARDFVPSPDELARKAYFSYENEGSRPGRDVQHWLAAEAELTAERNLNWIFHLRKTSELAVTLSMRPSQNLSPIAPSSRPEPRPRPDR
jgi:hypothetical protein